ncbi:hypothetical protein SAMN02910353_01185 [Ruminococcus sp. YRD2003]|uniref:hypothetical protein n=1 Tax=Ruminococcus sp. YRD2003 TaxID=1452313 RepID=UPI0008B59FC6|nr:hypothetical protein SAMN02910353_01185 [Ruminococcus flavefaciens]
MKKKMLSIITAAVCCMGAINTITSYGISVDPTASISCLKGDANLDTKATLADSVAILQHIANHDKYGLSPQGLVNADVDGRAGVTAKDARELLVRDSLKSESNETACMTFYTAKMDWTMGQSGFKDDIWSKIKDGYSGVITSADELYAYLSEICTEENITKYTEIYNEDFFVDNVLFMNAISQSVGGECALSIDSLDMSDDHISVNTRYAREITEIAVMSVCLGQVVFAKEAYDGRSVVWTCNEHYDVEPPTCTEVPVYKASVDWTMNHDGFKDGIWQRISGGFNSVITTTKQLDIYLSSICTDEKKAEYAEKYDEAFFAENVLFINTLPQSMCARPLFTINGVEVGEKIKIYAEWEDPQVGEAVMSVCMAQVVLPKSEYETQAVEWWISTNVASPFGDSDFPAYKKRVDYTFGYTGFRKENRDKLNGMGYSGVITSTDELTAYLTEVCTDEKIAEYAKLYDDKYFAEKVLFMNVIEQRSGASPCLYIGSVGFGDTITVNAGFDYTYAAANIMSVCVGAIELPKEAYKGQKVVWTCNDPQPEPAQPASLVYSAKTDWYCDTGSDMKPEVWDIVENGDYSAVITSSAELEEYLSKVLRKDLVTEYLESYNGFFTQNVLLMNCQLQTSGGKCCITVENAEYSEDGCSVTVTSSREKDGGASEDMLSVCLQQIKVPKELYDGQTVNWILS